MFNTIAAWGGEVYFDPVIIIKYGYQKQRVRQSHYHFSLKGLLEADSCGSISQSNSLDPFANGHLSGFFPYYEPILTAFLKHISCYFP